MYRLGFGNATLWCQGQKLLFVVELDLLEGCSSASVLAAGEADQSNDVCSGSNATGVIV